MEELASFPSAEDAFGAQIPKIERKLRRESAQPSRRPPSTLLSWEVMGSHRKGEIMLPLRQQVGCFGGWSGQWTHLGIEKEARGGELRMERSQQILRETHVSKLFCSSRHIPCSV